MSSAARVPTMTCCRHRRTSSASTSRGNPYGVADVLSAQFLPFPDESFDLVMCVEGFHYLADPEDGVAEIRRVLRQGGHALISVPLVWEYDRTVLEHRFTGPSLKRLFSGWEDVSVV